MSLQPTVTTPLALVVAVARNGVIGKNNGLPWHLPGELQYFKRRTLGKPLLMGRKTYQSIGRPLPGRTNIVVTRDSSFQAEGIEVCGSLDAAINRADEVARRDGADEIMVIGGAELFGQLLGRATAIYLTRVEADVDGDTWFPSWDPSGWSCRVLAEIEGTGQAFPYTLLEYRRTACANS